MTISTGINAERLAIFGLESEKQQISESTKVVCVKERAPQNLEVSLPHKMLRLASESVESQFARVPSAKQAKGCVAACNDYRKLQKAGKMSFWADKILGNKQDKSEVEDLTAEEVAQAEARREALLAALHDLMVQHKQRIAEMKNAEIVRGSQGKVFVRAC